MSSILGTKIQAANHTLLVRRNLDLIGDHFAEGYIAHLTDQKVSGGHAMIRSFLRLYQTAFPRIDVAVEILVESDDRVAWQRTLRAKHDGPFKGFPASGLEIVWRDVITSRFENGLIVEEWVITDLAEQLLMSRKRALPSRAPKRRRATKSKS